MAVKKKDKEKAILRAAEGLFYKNGFSATSTADIARKAGVNQPHVYYYFRSKEHLLEVILRKRLDCMHKLVDRAKECSEDVPFLVFFEGLLRKHLELIRANEAFMRFANGEALLRLKVARIVPESLGGDIRELIGIVEERAKAAMERGEIRRIDAENLFCSALSLNVAPFLIRPLVSRIALPDYKNYEVFLEESFAQTMTMVRAVALPDAEMTERASEKGLCDSKKD